MDVRRVAAAGVLTLRVAACGGGGSDTPSPVQPVVYRSIDVTTPDTVLTAVADSVRLAAVAVDGNGVQSAVASANWSTSDPQTVTVSTTGVVTARRGGVVRVSVRLGSVTDSVTITVSQLATSLTLDFGNEGPLIKAIGASVSATAAVKDRNGNAIPNVSISWAVADTTVARIDQNGVVTTRQNGRTQVIATAGPLTANSPFEVATRIRMPIDAYLATPVASARWEVPVVIVSYLPTADGRVGSIRKIPDFYTLNPLTLPVLEGNILDIVRRRKMALEQLSRFRGYATAAVLPSIGIRVVEHSNVYELLPASARPGVVANTRLPDWLRVFAELGLDTLVNRRGVKQIWVVTSSFDATFPSYNPAIHNLADARYVWESNMSSPTTGDVSNSDRFAGDLPVLARTYVVYGINFRRSQAEAIHNVGHQLKATLGFANQRSEGNTNLFWRSFVGQDAAGAFIQGRAGWTHMPPNTVGNYNYLNATPALFDRGLATRRGRSEKVGERRHVGSAHVSLARCWRLQPTRGSPMVRVLDAKHARTRQHDSARDRGDVQLVVVLCGLGCGDSCGRGVGNGAVNHRTMAIRGVSQR